MNLRSRQVQKTLHALRQTGHFVVVLKPGEIEGIPRSVLAEKIDDTIKDARIGEWSWKSRK